LVVLPREVRVGVQRIAVARQRTDRQPCVGDHRAVIGEPPFVTKQTLHVEMAVAGPPAGANLQRLDFSERLNPREHLLDVETAEHRREQTEFQSTPPAISRAGTLVHAPPLRWLSSTASTRH